MDSPEADRLAWSLFRVPATKAKLAAWFKAHAAGVAPDAHLAAIWQHTSNVMVLMSLANRFADRAALTAVACWGARQLLEHVAAGELRPRAALDVAEAWLAQRATLADVERAGRASLAAAQEAGRIDLDAPAVHACGAAGYAALTALGPTFDDDGNRAETGGNCGASFEYATIQVALRRLAATHPDASDPERDAHVREAKVRAMGPFADRIRGGIAAPTVAQLVERGR